MSRNVIIGIIIVLVILLVLLIIFRKKIGRYFLSMEQEYFIKNLHPSVKDKFAKLIKEIQKAGYKVIITSGYRTFAEQDLLKKQNASNASPGLSTHNYGFAIDINLVDINSQKIYKKATPKQEWIDTGIVAEAKKLGMRWGGEAFTGYADNVHFEVPVDTHKLLAQAQKQFGNDVAKIEGNKVNIA